jgi:uncharacterized protein (TIGR01777 family)
METVLITGGTGMIGHSLRSELLKKGFRVIILTRDKSKQKSNEANLAYADWNIERMTIDSDAVAQADHIIHLAGAGVAEKRWTKKRKQEIVDSRVKSGELLVKTLKAHPNQVKSVISISGIGWYGADAGSKIFVENDPPANDFLGNTCVQWEKAIASVQESGKRLVILRTGIVLDNSGGAIKEFKKPLQFGIASILGSGKQIVSWIHIDDMVNLFVYAIENAALNGVYNAVAPNPVSNKELILQLAKARNKFYIPIPVPAFVLKLVLGEMSIEVLKSATVSAAKIEASGFSFHYPTIESAIRKLAAS